MANRESSGAACALIAFEGTTVHPRLAEMLGDPRVAGVTLYGSINIDTAEQTQRLTSELQRIAGRPLLIAVDQEGGQLTAAGAQTTHFAGNMAIGATGDDELAVSVANAIGTELAALGINVNYAPVADIATRPYNPSLGIRSFGEDPATVSRLTAASVRGIQATGVAATLKHFPGKGDAQVDPHLELPVLDLDRDRLDRVEFASFRAGIEAGANLIMIGHYGLPAITGDPRLPTSASPAVLRGLVRDELGFGGVIVTDALDMGGFGETPIDAPLDAGADLLLFGPAQTESQFSGLPAFPRSSRYLSKLMAWLASSRQVTDLAVVGSTPHQRIAADLAARSITLVRDDRKLIPLSLAPETRVLAIMPQPTDLTPADTSSMVTPGLAPALRRRELSTTEIVVGYSPTAAEISRAVSAAAEHDLIVIGTIDANHAQTQMVSAVMGAVEPVKPVVTVSMRTPYDLAAYPEAQTHLATYSIHPHSMDALVNALIGLAPITGRLPVAIPGLYPIGHGLERRSR